MALSEDEKKHILQGLGREPSVVENMVFETMCSEHCSYKSTKPVLKRFPTKGSEVVLGVGEDSGIIAFAEHEGEQYGIAVSHESHNHPSQVLPIEGAATGVGGVVRDVYCMGADVFGVLDSLHFGISERKNDVADVIANRVVQGVSDYGNALGVPVLGGETLYHSSYNENCLVNVAALGILKTSDIIRSSTPQAAKSEPYDVILFGKSTDATGFGGAAFSSEILDDSSQNLGAVQVHDPFLKRVTVEAMKVLFKRVKNWGIEIGCKDLGAGGISCAASELASASGFGVKLNLDNVNVAIQNLDAEVIACSETQERFCVVVPRTHSQQVLDIFNVEFELPKLYEAAGASIIGEIMTNPRFEMHHKGALVCDIPIGMITTEVLVPRESKAIPKITQPDPILSIKDNDLEPIMLAISAHDMCCSKRYVYRYYDQAVRGDTVAYPGEVGAVVVKPIEDSDVGCAVSMDSNTYGEFDPYLAGAAAVCESVRNVIATGARPIALTDCLNYGSPENPNVFWGFQEGVRGISEAAETLSLIPGEPLPIISGNVSLYNQSKAGNSVVPSPVVCCVGRIENIHLVVKSPLQKPGLSLFCIQTPQRHMAGSILVDVLATQNKLNKADFKQVFDINLALEAKQNQALLSLMDQCIIEACQDISYGGLYQCLVEMLLGERANQPLGLALDFSYSNDLASSLFSEVGGYVIAIESSSEETLQKCLNNIEGLLYHKLGHTTEVPQLTLQKAGDVVVNLSYEALKKAFFTKNESVFATP